MSAEFDSQNDDGTILTNNGPWGGGGGNNNPWGQRPGNGGGNNGSGRKPEPDLDDMLRQAQNRFKNTFGNRGASGGTPGAGVVFFGLLGVALLFWLASGLYRVQPEENAAIMTFGKWTDTRSEPGLGYHLPWPIQDAIKENVAFDRRLEIGSPELVGRTGGGRSNMTPESMMLTGDENIIDINFVVLWRVSDAGQYLFNIRNPDITIKKVAESAMRETIGRTQIQKALTEARGDIEIQTKALMQKILDDYQAGVVINSVQLLRVNPPSPVVDAFDDVQRARTDRERLRNEAETYRNDIVPRARGEAQKMLQDAEAYKEAVTSKAQGDADRFLSVYRAYASAKDVTQKRLYIETMQEILQNSRKIIVGDDKGMPILPYMNVDQPKAAGRVLQQPQPKQ